MTPDERPSWVEWAEEEPSARTEETVALPPPAPPRQRTKAVLTVVSGSSAGRVHTLQDTETLLGRGKEAHARLDDTGASRTHARIVRTEDGGWLLEDLRSRNGTFVDGRRIERIELKSGDRIHIGPNVVVSFAVLDAQAERLTAQLYESSVRDALTRAYNRRYLVERLASEIAYARRHGSRLSLVILDIDHFKRVNDPAATWRATTCCASSPRWCSGRSAPRTSSRASAARSSWCWSGASSTTTWGASSSGCAPPSSGSRSRRWTRCCA